MMGTLTGGFERFFQHMGTADRPRHQGPAAVHPGLPADAGGRPAAQHAVHAGLPVARRLSRPHRRERADRRAGVRVSAPPAAAAARSAAPLPHSRRRLASGCCRCAVRGASPASGRWSWICGCPPAGDAPVPVVVFLHGGGWRLGSRHSAGPAYATADPARSSRSRRPGSRWPASTTGSPARRSGRPSCTTPRPPSAGCAPAPRTRHRPRADRRLGRVGRRPPGRAARPHHRRPGAGGRGRHRRSVERGVRRRRLVRAQRRRRRRNRSRRRPGRPGQPRGAAARRRRRRRVPELAAQASPISHVSAGRAAVPAAARRAPTGWSRPCRASGCTRRWPRPAPTSSCTCTTAPTTCGWARRRPPPTRCDRTIDVPARQLRPRLQRPKRQRETDR